MNICGAPFVRSLILAFYVSRDIPEQALEDVYPLEVVN